MKDASLLRVFTCALAAGAALIGGSAAGAAPAGCLREIVVLGAGQDAGAPQIGNLDDIGEALYPSSLGLIDREAGTRYLLDATPAITQQLAMLDAVEPPAGGNLGLDGVFLTHAHMGHYLGLAWFGLEAANTRRLSVHVMERMAGFLRGNAPWSQLIEQEQIALSPLAPETFAVLSDELGLLPLLVPHRDELSETVGFLIMTPDKRALYMPDLDSWDDYAAQSGSSLEELVAGVDYAFIDATFWDDNELSGRDMSAIPHPRVITVMERLAGLPAPERAKVHFIHYNHTNPIREPESEQSREVERRGFNIAREGLRVCLAPAAAP